MPITKPSPRWSGPQHRVAVLLAGGATVRVAAERAKVGRRTIYDWMSGEAGYQEYVASLRTRAVGCAVGRLARRATKAVDVLAKLLDHKDAEVRLRAATAVLGQLARLRDHVELAERVEELERRGKGA